MGFVCAWVYKRLGSTVSCVHLLIQTSYHFYTKFKPIHTFVTMNSNTNNNVNTGNEDYLDKGLDAVEKKFGGSMGQDTQKNRGVNEKIVSRVCLCGEDVC